MRDAKRGTVTEMGIHGSNFTPRSKFEHVPPAKNGSAPGSHQKNEDGYFDETMHLDAMRAVMMYEAQRRSLLRVENLAKIIVVQLRSGNQKETRG